MFGRKRTPVAIPTVEQTKRWDLTPDEVVIREIIVEMLYLNQNPEDVRDILNRNQSSDWGLSATSQQWLAGKNIDQFAERIKSVYATCLCDTSVSDKSASYYKRQLAALGLDSTDWFRKLSAVSSPVKVNLQLALRYQLHRYYRLGTGWL